MSDHSPLLKDLSLFDKVKSFVNSVEKSRPASLFLTSPAARTYIIGALGINNRIALLSDDALVLYHGLLDMGSLGVQYLPALADQSVIPKSFRGTISRQLSSFARSMSEVAPDIIFTEGGLQAHVPEGVLTKSDDGITVCIKDKDIYHEILEKVNLYGYTENDEAKNIGDYARRGGIIDVFPNNVINPIRLEFDNNVLVSIRHYNPTSQISINTISTIFIPKINNNIKEMITNTYEDILLGHGYLVLYEKTKSGLTEISSEYKEKICESNIIKIRELQLNETKNMGKNLRKIPKIYVFGTKRKTSPIYPSNSIYLNGHSTGNVLFEDCGIAIVSNKKKKTAESTLKNDRPGVGYDLIWGDFITHIDYGVGIFRGLIKKEDGDYIRLEYKNNSTVLLSIHRLDKITPHIGKKQPNLNALGGRSWIVTKTNTIKQINDIIEEMAVVKKNRDLQRATPYKNDDYLEKSLEETFPYIETADQRKAINDIYGDMASPGLMDRIIIGDVGFGKTEVALRAAAKAAFSGVLVMIVVPTTILADQHYILFKNRLEKYGVSVEMISRFITEKKQNAIIKDIKRGKINVIVGTHKLLNKSIPKTNLGLLVVDEEHRFGVAQKNRILKLKMSIDVLTLTATPIPRTLQQSMLGLKSVSIINTPPIKRVPIKTQVVYKKWSFIKKIMDIEINRGGQVYFLHNRIESIPFYKKKISSLFPGVNIETAHGGMNSKELESTILSFFDGKIQVLITTTIIEAGLDVPNANTIIINGAHLYGLSQLYQIRGRVGRGNKQGYCYLIIPKVDGLSDSAIERLKTIQENTDLGSGYNIAMKDLEIRGAGNIFGYEQSGHISGVGYHLYCKLFNNEVNRKAGGGAVVRVPKIQFYGKASFSDKYMPLLQDRLYFYQLLSNVNNKKEIVAVQEEISDRYGRPPKETRSLYKITEARIVYTNTLVKNILIEKDRTLLMFNDIDAETIDEMFIEKIMDSMTVEKIKFMFKESKKDSQTLEINSRLIEDPLGMLIGIAELFSYKNNNT